METRDGIPDYTRCSLEDLYDVRRRIDASRFPARAAALEAEIAAREAGGRPDSARKNAETPWKPPWFRDPRSLGIYMVVAGVWALAVVYDAGRITGETGRALWISIPIIVYGALIVAGAMAALKLTGWRWTALVAWALQVPSVRLWRIAYGAFSPPVMEVKVWPETGFSASLSPQFSVSLFPGAQPVYLGVNIVALSAVVFLMDRVSRRSEARRRHESRRSLV